MTTSIAISLGSVCAGQGHLHLNIQVNGGAAKELTFDVDELAEPLGWEDTRAAALLLLRAHFRGMSKAQAKSALQAGLDLVI